MKFLFDFFPILLFFIAYKLYGIYTATVVAILATFVQVGMFWIKHRRFEKMHLITLAMIVVLGGATLIFHDEMFIKWKPSVLDWLFGVAFFGSQFFGKKYLTQRMLGANVTLPSHVWNKLDITWGLFWISLGFANLYVAYNFDTNTWVNFKLFGSFGLTLALAVAQVFYLMRHINAEVDPGNSEEG